MYRRYEIPLDRLNLPTRMQNWVASRDVRTLGALVRNAPNELLDERNLGRTTIKRTRLIIENHLGESWEAARRRLMSGEDAAEAPPMGAPAMSERSLDMPLEGLILPTRMQNWVRRRGIRTLGELVRNSPEELLEEPNLGRKTVQRTRLVIEDRLGEGWERARARLAEDNASESTEASGETSGEGAPLDADTPWHDLLLRLPEHILDLPLDAIQLPARMRTLAASEGIATVRELVTISSAELRARPNLGRATIESGRKALVELALADEQEHPTALAALTYHVARLPLAPRLVITRRAGLHGTSQTLQEIADVLGVSRERVRQLEARGIEELQRSGPWLESARDHLQTLVGERSQLFSTLAADPWWSDLAGQHELFVYFLERVFQAELTIVTCGDHVLIGRLEQGDLDRAWQNLRDGAKSWDYPIGQAAVDEAVDDTAAELGDGAREALRQRLDDHLHWRGTGGARTALAFGRDRSAEVLSFLREQGRPVPVQELWATVGRCLLPDEVLYFERGVVGLETHFPDFQHWLDVVPAFCVEVMTATAPDRQWHCTELFEEAREAEAVPDWFNHWHVASLLRRSQKVEYLGRLRVALPHASVSDERIHVEDALAEVLEGAGAPLELEEIADRVRQKTHIPDATIGQTLRTASFVQVDADHWGLFERDLPGGAEAAESVRDLVADSLEEMQHGMTAFEMWMLVQREDACPRGWTEEMVRSVVRSDPRFRLSRAGNVGLALWDSVRVPRRLDIARALLQEHGGHLPVDALNSQLERRYGKPADRIALASFANQMNARLAGDLIVANAPAEAIPAKPTEPSQSDELADPPRAQLPVEQAFDILRGYRAPSEPRLSPELAARVTEMIEDLLRRESADEIPLIDNYIDGKLHYLGFSATPWLRDLGRAAYALRQLQLRERTGDCELSPAALQAIRAGLYYLVKRDDVIPDETDTIGYLDDAFAIATCAAQVVEVADGQRRLARIESP